MKSKTIIHLLSGGLDSVTMLYDLHEQGHAVHSLMIDYGQQHLKELTYAEGHVRRLGLKSSKITLPPLGGLNDESWIVPNRNMIMLSIAVNRAVQSRSDTVTIGCNADDDDAFPDCRQMFLFYLNQTIDFAELGVEICAPYLKKRKWEIGDLARQLGVPMSDVWTCYRGGEKPCMECPACLKFAAATLNGKKQ